MKSQVLVSMPTAQGVDSHAQAPPGSNRPAQKPGLVGHRQCAHLDPEKRRPRDPIEETAGRGEETASCLSCSLRAPTRVEAGPAALLRTRWQPGLEQMRPGS